MALAIKLADFTPGEADELRRSIAAWRSSASIAKMANRLMQGLINSGMPQDFANLIFEQMQGFAHYGFPESHAASFALLAYASCYLKCHHPAEFLAALINSQPMGFYSVHTLIFDGQRHGVKVLAVNPNQSQWDCQIVAPQTVLLGLRSVVGLSRKDADDLILVRQKSKFKNLGDFLSRTSIRRDVLCRLAMANAFEDFGLTPRDALWSILQHVLLLESKNNPQGSLFNSMPVALEDSQLFDGLNKFESIQEDFLAYDLTTHGHPMAVLREQMPLLPKTNTQKIKDGPERKTKLAGLLVVRQRPPTANGVTFSTIEDETGFLDLVLWKDVSERVKEIFLNHSFVIVSGKIQKDRNTTAMIVDDVQPVWPETSPIPVEAIQYFA